MRVRAAAPLRVLLSVLFAALAAGCSDGGPTEPEPTPTEIITSDASTSWAFVSLGTPATSRTVADPATDAGWDIAFNATAVMVNGGTDGPAGVVAYCLCQNEGATDEQVLAMTAEGELADFEAISASDVPAAGDPGWSSEVFETRKWYRYDIVPGSHAISPTFEVYLVKRGSDVYKVQLVNYYGPAGEFRQITMRYAQITG